jgi:hypothetical protein
MAVWCYHMHPPPRSSHIDLSRVAPVLRACAGHSLAICGFNTRERVVFLTTLMSFGPPFVHPTIEQGWAAFDKAFKGSKDRLQVSHAAAAAANATPLYGITPSFQLNS